MTLFLAQSNEKFHELQQTCIEQSDERTADDDDRQHHAGVGEDGLLGRPCDILELGSQVAEPLADLLKDIRLCFFLLAIGFLSLLCAFGRLRSLGDF